MMVVVKQEHIEAGIRNSPNSCPIARAVRECLGIDGGVVVSEYAIHISNEKTTKRYDVPAVVRSFIKRFDVGEYVEPLEFELRSK